MPAFYRELKKMAANITDSVAIAAPVAAKR